MTQYQSGDQVVFEPNAELDRHQARLQAHRHAS